jgi:hypothetical protein
MRTPIIFFLGLLITTTTNSQVKVIDKPDRNVMEIRNELLGIVIPKESAFDPKNAGKIPAPIQSIIYYDGSYSDNTTNYLLYTVPATSLKVKIVKQTTDECIIELRYTFKKPEFTFMGEKYKGGGPGPGYYLCTITIRKNSKSVIVEEDSNYDICYFLKLNRGLNPNKARYRGWSATSPEFGQMPDGSVYRQYSENKYVDATVTIRHTKDEFYQNLSLWQPAGGEINTGHYWMLFNDQAQQSANMLGFYHGRPSRYIQSGNNGVRLFLRMQDEVMKEEKNIIELYVSLQRRGPDNSWAPHRRIEWCLYISTKQDVLPPEEIQPIAIEQNNVTGLGKKIDTYAQKKAVLIPAFYQGALYMPKHKIQELIAKVKKDDDFYNKVYLYNYDLKPVLDAWRDKKAAQTLINEIVSYGKNLETIYKSGDGIHTFSTVYWRGAMVFKKMALQASCLFADTSIKIQPAEKRDIEKTIALMARISWDDDNVPLQDTAGVNYGPANMYSQFKNNGRSFFALLFANDPEFSARAKMVATEVVKDINNGIYENGSSFATPHYTQTVIDPILFTMLQLKQAGIKNLFAEKGKLYRFFDFYTSLLTPPSVRFSGNRKLISLGDGSEESATSFGLMAAGIEESDEKYSKKLYSIFYNGPIRTSIYGYIALTIDLTRNPKIDFQSANSNYDGYLSHFRSSVNTENESALWVLNGDKYFDHRNDDRGEFVIYALKTPVSLSRSCFYYPRAWGAAIRNMVIPENRFPEWSGSNQPIEPDSKNGLIWHQSSQVEYASLGKSAVSISKMERKPETWVRKIVMISSNEERPIFIFFDSINNNQPNIWSMLLMSEGTVQTPAGAITPNERIHNGNTLQQLPEGSPARTLQKGIQRFSFTGQAWPVEMHSTRGINFDLYTVSPISTEFSLAQWTTTWQNSIEAQEYNLTMKKPYSEAQQIIRVKSKSPFFHLLIPYKKGEAPYTVAAQENNRILLSNNSEQIIVSSKYYFFTTTAGKKIIASFGSEKIIEKGFSIEGGPTEIEVEGNEIIIRIHGNSGVRKITIPYKIKSTQNLPMKVIPGGTQIEINFKSKGLNMLSSQQGYEKFIFKML